MWRLTPGQRLLHRGWDGEYVLYNDLSGDTHLLDASAIGLLLALRDAAADCAGQPDDLLADLEALSLIEFFPC